MGRWYPSQPSRARTHAVTIQRGDFHPRKVECRITRDQGKSGTMVSLVGPGRSYQGFLEKSGPTRVLSYQGLLSPTRVFGRPQADPRLSYQGFWSAAGRPPIVLPGFWSAAGRPRLSYQGFWSAAGRRPSERDANNSFKTTGAQNGYNYLYNVNHGNEFDRSNITERQLVKPW